MNEYKTMLFTRSVEKIGRSVESALELKELIDEALDNAVQNGYSLFSVSNTSSNGLLCYLFVMQKARD